MPPQISESQSSRPWGRVHTIDDEAGYVEFEGEYSGRDPEGFSRALHKLLDPAEEES